MSGKTLFQNDGVMQSSFEKTRPPISEEQVFIEKS